MDINKNWGNSKQPYQSNEAERTCASEPEKFQNILICWKLFFPLWRLVSQEVPLHASNKNFNIHAGYITKFIS